MSVLLSAGQRQVWGSFSRAVGAELRESRTIRGVSGLDHPVQAVAVDEKAKRVIVVSAEASPRVAALMQVDVQATMPEARVIVARPVIVDLGVLARRVLAPLGSPVLKLSDINEFSARNKAWSDEDRKDFVAKYLEGIFKPLSIAWQNTALPTFNQLMDVVNQASYMDWKAIWESIKPEPSATEIDLSSMANIDNTALDRRYGICPIPLYELNESDWELLLDEKRNDELRNRLKALDILQYFYPPPDQLALGLIDNGMKSEPQILDAITSTPALGHPLAQPEILPQLDKVSEVLAALKEKGYVAEGEFGFEIAPSGVSVRGTMKYRPKEGIVSKVLSRFNLSLSATPRDFLGH